MTVHHISGFEYAWFEVPPSRTEKQKKTPNIHIVPSQKSSPPQKSSQQKPSDRPLPKNHLVRSFIKIPKSRSIVPSKTPKSVSFFALNSRLSVSDSVGISGISGLAVTLGSLRLVAVVSVIGSQLSLSRSLRLFLGDGSPSLIGKISTAREVSGQLERTGKRVSYFLPNGVALGVLAATTRRGDDMLMKAAGKDCTSGAMSLLGFSAIFSAILLAQESIYGQMAAYMKESGEGSEGTAKWLLDEIARRETDAERSLMHSPSSAIRRELWETFGSISFTTNVPWILADDFNALLRPDDKIQGTRPKVLCKRFRNLVTREGFRDIHCVGLKYIRARGLGHEKLDRVLMNSLWTHQFDTVVVEHLHRIHSNHSPLCFQVKSISASVGAKKRFRYLNAWESDTEWDNFVNTCWVPTAPMHQAVKNFSLKADPWNHQKRKFSSLICVNSVSNSILQRNRDGIYSVSKIVVADSISNENVFPLLIRDGLETKFRNGTETERNGNSSKGYNCNCISSLIRL
ncbi:hypothetical protein Syun_011903 [Stephania yunnanensis]|uniref:Uncharacterized protein n=1 Tax=Stephania yunnanensis TaxID=152371 RepID=A0AAP0JZP7_9MAGN